jgi:hypothetical protein
MRTAIGPHGEGLVFLLGLPRSGTTLLSIMLDNHPDVASPAEPWIMLALAELGRVSVRHPANASVLGTAVARFAGPEGRVIAARAAARALYDTHLEARGKCILVDKTPRYWLIADFLIEVFPRARFIWLRRDPMDIAASYKSTWNIDLAATLQQGIDVPELLDLTLGLEWLTAFYKRHRDAVHVVFYERLVAAPRDELGAVLRHIGIDAPLELLGSLTRLDAAKRAPQSFGDEKIRATTAPHMKSIGTWRHVLNRDQLQVILDAVGAEQLVALGYADTVNALEMSEIYPSGGPTTTRFRASAMARLAARQADITRVTGHGFISALPTVQRRVHAAIAGEATWAAFVEAEIRRLEAPMSDLENLATVAPAAPLGRFSAPLRRAVQRWRRKS